MGGVRSLSAEMAETPEARRAVRGLSPRLLGQVPDSAARFRYFKGLAKS